VSRFLPGVAEFPRRPPAFVFLMLVSIQIKRRCCSAANPRSPRPGQAPLVLRRPPGAARAVPADRDVPGVASELRDHLMILTPYLDRNPTAARRTAGPIVLFTSICASRWRSCHREFSRRSFKLGLDPHLVTWIELPV